MQQISAHRAASAAAPKVVSIVAAGAAAIPEDVARLLVAAANDDDASMHVSAVAVPHNTTIAIPRHRQRLTLLRPARSISAVLEAGKAVRANPNLP